MKLDVVVGGQFGSEAKGHATQRIVQRRMTEHGFCTNLRVGGPNAGHTGYDRTGKAWALRQVPIGVVCEGPVSLGIAAGSEIDPAVLLDELEQLTAAGLMADKTLYIHPEATIIDQLHKDQETELIGRIGSTGKGIGAARADRLMRSARRVTDSPEFIRSLSEYWATIGQTTGHPLVVEGVQGYGLGLHAGYYPQCTSSDCRAIDFLSMAGVNPWQFDDLTVWVVARPYPIRVAGNSGPMRDETTWEALELDPEFTTVTKKIRRVGMPDWDLVRLAVRANGPSAVQLAISMVDQRFPHLKDHTYDSNDANWEIAEQWLEDIEQRVGAPIGLVMSGPNTAGWRK